MMKYPDKHCDYTGAMGANHTEPFCIDGEVHTIYLSDEAHEKMMAIGARIRNGDETASKDMEDFLGRISENTAIKKP